MDAHTATIRVAFPGHEAAEQAMQALAPENDGFLEAIVEESELVLTAHADSIMGLLRTVDDALGCLRATGIE